jgi:hypothetical protein
MRRAIATGFAGILGFGVCLTLTALQWKGIKLPTWAFILGLAIGGCMILYGLAGWTIAIWRKPNDALAYINGRLELGNRLLGFWPEHSQGHEMIETVCAWELETYRGLGEKLPHKQAYFRVDGLDREYPDEPHIRLMLRQRIRRLSEIAGRL